MMTRAQLEAQFWAITGRNLTGAQVDDLMDAAEHYAAERHRNGPRASPPLQPCGTDLYPLISVLAKAMLGDEAGATIHELRKSA